MMPEKSLVAAAAVDEALVELLGLAAHRRVGADALRGFHRQLQVLEHQRRREPAFIIAVGGRVGADAGHRAIAGHRPALARRLGRDVEEGLRVEPELLRQHERLAGRDHGRAEEHVVADLGGLARAGLAGVDHRLAHRLEERAGRARTPRRCRRP